MVGNELLLVITSALIATTVTKRSNELSLPVIVPGSRWNLLPPGTITCFALLARQRLKPPL